MNKKNMLSLLVFLFFLYGSAIKAHQIQDSNYTKITIASEVNYVPYCTLDKEGKPTGFSVELFLAAAQAMHLDVDIELGLWTHISQKLADGKIDALPIVGHTPERDSIYDFTMPYLSLDGAAFVKKSNTNIHTFDDLRGKKILVMKGDHAEEYLNRIKITPDITTTFSFQEAFKLLKSGNYDAIICQRVLGVNILNDLKIDKITPCDFIIPDFRTDYCFAVHKGNTALLKTLNEGLSIVMANKTYDKLYHKWLGPKIKEKIAIKDIIRIGLFIIIPLLFMSALVVIISLRKLVQRKTKRLQLEVIEHKETYNRLMKNQRLLEKMGSVAKVGGWEFDAKTGQGTWTAEVSKIHDLDPNEPTNAELGMSFYINESKQLIENAINKSIKEGTPYDLILEMKTAKGNHKWVHSIANPILENGKVVSLEGSFQDITELVASENELRKLKDELDQKVIDRTRELDEKVEKLKKSQRAMLYMVEDLHHMTQELETERKKLASTNNELEAFSYSVSHDLRAPLRAINGFSQMLIEDFSQVLGSEGLKLLQVVIDNSQKMDHLIADLLQLSRVTRGELKQVPINMEHMARSVFNELIQNENTELIQLKLKPIPNATGDETLMRQVWQNLIGNALKYSRTREERIIEIKGALSGTEVMYVVKDNGVGFDSAFSDKLFMPFQRLHTDKEFEGTGIGLSIVQRIIARHNGKVWAQSEADKGAAFYISLPNMPT